MKILDRLPIYDQPTLIDVRGEVYQVWKNQAIIWISFAETLPPFPAILDTGHSHNLSIARRQMRRWGSLGVKQIGHAKIAGCLVPRYQSDLFVHRNIPRTHHLSGTYALKMDGGIVVVPDELPIAPRLPLLGIQSIIANKLRLLINGERQQVTLKTRGWM
jgi:hypothetical protein